MDATKRTPLRIRPGLIAVFGILLMVGLVALARVFMSTPTAPTPHVSSSVQNEPNEMIALSQGTATIVRQGQTKTVSPGETIPLEENDTVTTNKETVALIRYSDDTLVRLGPETTVVFHRTKDGKVAVENKIGSIYARFKKLLGVTDSLEVETPTAVATVRGTAFSVWHRKDNTSRISVVEDTVDVVKKDETGKRRMETQTSIPQDNKADVHPAKEQRVRVSKILETDEERNWLLLNKEADSEREKKRKTLCPTCRLRYVDERQILATVSAKFLPQLFLTPTPSATPSATPTKPAIPIIQSMPGEGYSRSLVQTPNGQFPLSCIGGNQTGIRVITDSANESDCKDNCPVLPLGEFASRNGGFAAMNGMYFCPADYPICTGKTNSFDTLFFNSRVKRYINSDNNVYSVLPFFVTDSGGNPIFKAKTLEWGRDTGISAGTAGNPLLLLNGSLVATDTTLDDKQRTVQSNRGAIVQKGTTLYLCIVGNATVLDSANVYGALHADNAMNIDGGGSSALWLNGSYIYGPGRNIPTAIIFAKK
ncbi:phosphodiester glycosidase family protein [Candidatus Gottesmanbacteria bacterium]|nr:phosphodiester glycosidase family protein [Candidatus Gottesmanbacteria bacterium]